MKAITHIQAKVPTKVDQREVVTDKGHHRAKSKNKSMVAVWVKSAASKQVMTTAHAHNSLIVKRHATNYSYANTEGKYFKVTRRYDVAAYMKGFDWYRK